MRRVNRSVKFARCVGTVAIVALCVSSQAARADDAPAAAATSTPAPPAASSPTTGTRVQWNNTLKYSTGIRLNAPASNLATFNPSAGQVTQINVNDGDNNFKAGSFTSSRFDLLSELDVTGPNAGLRVSGEAWYDPVYESLNGNTSPSTVNQFSVPYNNFTAQTKKVVGLGGQLLDAFVFAKGNLGPNVSGSVRIGQHALIWGETLFFGDNGVAGAMSPVDLVKLLSVPDSEFKEILLPVPQVSTQLQLTPDLSFAAYYQAQWVRDRFVPVGAYLSIQDIYDEGGERLFFPQLAGFPPLAIPAGVPTALFRGPDTYGKNSGQFGVSFGFRPPGSNLDLGLYALQFNDKGGQLLLSYLQNANPAIGKIGEYSFDYANGIQVFGASVSTSFGNTNLAAELSFRSHQDLVSNAGFNVLLPFPMSPPFPVPAYNTTNAPFWATGNTAHLNVSILQSFDPNFIAKESTLAFEIAANTTMSVTGNASALDPNTTATAAAFRLLYTPVYRSVKPSLDIELPFSIGMGIFGNSSAVTSFPAGGVGDLEFGLAATYRQAWKGTLTYTHYLGPSGPYLDQNNQISGQQSLSDRSSVAASLSRSF